MTTVDIQRKLISACRLYDGAKTTGERRAALRAIERLNAKYCEIVVGVMTSMLADLAPVFEDAVQATTRFGESISWLSRL